MALNPNCACGFQKLILGFQQLNKQFAESSAGLHGMTMASQDACHTAPCRKVKNTSRVCLWLRR